MRGTIVSLGSDIYKKHISLIRDLNDTYIFVNQSFSYLDVEIIDRENSDDKSDYEYDVPANKSKSKKAYRTEKEIAEIFSRFVDYELYESFLSIMVSKFESFLFFCMMVIIRRYPQKITTKIQGIQTNTDISIENVLLNKDYNLLLNKIIENQLISVSYASPKLYWKYFEKITGIQIDQKLIDKYIELKASRDLIIHNNSIINDVYLEKVGKLARAEEGRIPIDNEYFKTSIALLKTISGIISREAKSKYVS